MKSAFTDLHHHLCKRLGGTLADDSAYGGPPTLLLPQGGAVYLSAWLRDQQLNIADVIVEPPGIGIGSAMMEAIREFAAARQLSVRVVDVTNPGFFDRFSWLTPVAVGLHQEGRPTTDYLSHPLDSVAI